MLILSGLIGALIGASVTLLFNIWKLHRDEQSARADELCRAVTETAAIASAYWSIDFSDGDRQQDQDVSEAKIQGAQTLIDGLYADFRSTIRRADATALDDRLSDLSDALSGGQFSELGRPRDPTRIRSAPALASWTVVEVRRCHRNTMPLGAAFRGVHENRQRALDMPPSFRG